MSWALKQGSAQYLKDFCKVCVYAAENVLFVGYVAPWLCRSVHLARPRLMHYCAVGE